MTTVGARPLHGTFAKLVNDLGPENATKLGNVLARPMVGSVVHDALSNPTIAKVVADVGTKTLPFAGITRHAMRFGLSDPVAGAVDVGLRSAKAGAGLLARLPGPFRGAREQVAQVTANVHEGAKELHASRALIDRWFELSQHSPARVRSMLADLSDPDFTDFIATISKRPKGATPAETAVLEERNAAIRAALVNVISGGEYTLR